MSDSREVAADQETYRAGFARLVWHFDEAGKTLSLLLAAAPPGVPIEVKIALHQGAAKVMEANLEFRRALGALRKYGIVPEEEESRGLDAFRAAEPPPKEAPNRRPGSRPGGGESP